MNIFVPNFVDTNDYTQAMEMGDLIFMTKGVVVMHPDALHKKFATYFQTAEEGDALLLSGSNLICSIAYAEWMQKFPISRKLISFDRRAGYTLHHINF